MFSLFLMSEVNSGIVLLVLISLLNLLCISLHKDLISAVVRNSHSR